jgi:hypothetical protein
MAEAAARIKISNPNAPFQFEDLPADRNAVLWSEIRTEYGLTLAELSALINARCSSQGIIQLLPLDKYPTYIFDNSSYYLIISVNVSP